MIDPNIWQSEDFAKLSLLAKIVFIGMFSIADDEGRGRAKPVYLRSILFPYDDNMRMIDIEKALSEIGSKMSVTLYAHDGNEYYQLNNWLKWQRVDKPLPSKMPSPELLQSYSRVAPELLSPKIKEDKIREREEEEKRRESGAAAPSRSERHEFGEYGWVKLTTAEYERLKEDFGNDTVLHYIKVVDEKAQKTGNKNKWKDWNLTLRNAIRDKWGGDPPKHDKGGSFLDQLKRVEEMRNDRKRNTGPDSS